ncbi:MAG: hypothetical protein HY551_05535 [Elusimicrobia bacterium]|nr:hypothetical protein [Elusimicrobiota bacterium]
MSPAKIIAAILVLSAAATLHSDIATGRAAIAEDFPAGKISDASSETTPPRRRAPRRRSRYKNRAKKSQAPRKPRVELSGRWRDETRKALEGLIASRGNQSEDFDEARRPIAILILDDVSILGSVAETAFYHLVTDAAFKFDDFFWKRLPPPYDRRALAGYNGFSRDPQVIWPKNPYYQAYRKALFSAYQDICRREGRRTCGLWLSKLLAGFKEGEWAQYMKDVITKEMGSLKWESVRQSPEDETPIRVRHGIALIPEIEELCGALTKNGFDLWILSASNAWGAQLLADYYKVDPSRVVGVRPRVRSGVLQEEIINPVPVGSGEAEAVTLLMGRAPDLALGGEHDRPLLEYGEGLRVLFSEEARSHQDASRRGWLIEPGFAESWKP